MLSAACEQAGIGQGITRIRVTDEIARLSCAMHRYGSRIIIGASLNTTKYRPFYWYMGVVVAEHREITHGSLIADSLQNMCRKSCLAKGRRHIQQVRLVD